VKQPIEGAGMRRYHKNFSIISAVIALITTIMCITSTLADQNKNLEMKNIFNRLIDIQQKYISRIKNESKSEKIIEAIDAFNNEMSSLYSNVLQIDSSVSTGDFSKESKEVSELLDLKLRSEKLSETIRGMTLTTLYRFSSDEKVVQRLYQTRDRFLQIEK
jgi:hypothetical protein